MGFLGAFVGVFVARISRGRTLRQYVTVVLLAPTLICVLAFSIFGGTAIWLQRSGTDIASAASPEEMLFLMLGALPLSQITPIAIIILLSVFFITSADSATLVMASMSQQGKPHPDKKITIFWGLALAGVSSVMLLVGGSDALQGLQDLVTVAALPFALILLALIPAFLRDLSTDPMSLRHRYARKALDNAVRQGMDQHGDDFAIEIRHENGPAAAGHDVDSTSERISAWYQRTDEDDRPVDYDYREDKYVEDEPSK